MRRCIAEARGVQIYSICPGAGSSQLIFTAFGGWIGPFSRILLLDPTYAEYGHILDTVIGAKVCRLALRRRNGYQVDLEELSRSCKTVLLVDRTADWKPETLPTIYAVDERVALYATIDIRESGSSRTLADLSRPIAQKLLTRFKGERTSHIYA